MKAANAEYLAGSPFRRVLLLEEAHGFVPEWNISTFPQRDATAESTRYIMQARKFGLRFVMVSQRTAVVSKSALSQCENYVVLRTTDETSLTYLEAVMGREAREALPRLRRFEAVCMGPAFNADGPVIVSLDAP
jgi:DNA helicase HerA-like ATPase